MSVCDFAMIPIEWVWIHILDVIWFGEQSSGQRYINNRSVPLNIQDIRIGTSDSIV